MGKLTAIKVKNAKAGRHADGEGLYLLVNDNGARSWMLRVQVSGKRRDIGLGAVSGLGLAEAREKAAECRKLAKSGLDPVAERKKAPIALVTFEQAARDCHDQLKSGWRNKKHTDSWLSCLVNYAFPAIGSKPVGVVDSIMVRDLLAPIWMEKAETSRRVLQRIGAVLDFAHIKGWRPTETTLKSVRKGLPRQKPDDTHFEAMAYEDVPAFIRALRSEAPTVGRDALQFTILNAVRSNETRFAAWPEVDLEKKTWTIPGSRMKMNQTHIVPLTPAATEILQRRREFRTSDNGLVFSAARMKAELGKLPADKPISDMTMTKVVKDSAYAEALRKTAEERGDDPKHAKIPTVHGFRSSFTDWAAEATSTPKEIVDKALAHKLPDKVEAAYRRTDFFEKRRTLMAAWAAYLVGGNNVIRLAASTTRHG
ncbi:MAG: recombinase [Bradyrhizobium sp.]|nr:recombinase [Bradyrhizobium sp.]